MGTTHWIFIFLSLLNWHRNGAENAMTVYGYSALLFIQRVDVATPTEPA